MKKFKFNPVFTFIILIISVIVLSGVLSFFNVQAEYSTVNTATNELTNNVVQVENLLSPSGIKHIVTHAVSDFVNFAPLSMLIIVLIGIGVLEKTGFLKTLFTVLTQTFRKNTITFWVIFISMLFSIVGDLGFVVMLPLAALLFKYGHRNPLGGIIASFAGVAFGYGVNVLMSSTESSLLTMTLNASKILDPNYQIGNSYGLFIMLAAQVVLSIAMTAITEKKVMPKLGKYEFDEIETLDKIKMPKKDLKGLIIGLGAGLVYTLIIVYAIIPGLPFSGTLLDDSAQFYIDKLLGSASLFKQGLVFIITLWFMIVGFAYGIASKTVKNNKDIANSLSHSLDGIGNIIVLIFLASLFISTFKQSNIGMVFIAALSNLINTFNLTGIGLIILLFVIGIISTFFYNSLSMRWNILSGITVPVFMNASLSPELAQLTFLAGASVSAGLTPVMAYFVIYIALIEKYNQGEESIGLFGSLKHLKYYSLATLVVWFILIIGFYITGIPLGPGSLAGVSYVA